MTQNRFINRPIHRSRSSARRWLHRIFAGMEPLEARALLSVTVAANAKSATYTDVDGDLVTVAITAGTLTTANFTTTQVAAGRDQLQLIDLTAAGFAGSNLTVTVKRVGTGDGVANIGYINASGNDLGTVSIAGDVGRIDAGNANAATVGIKSLTVRSLGRLGLDTQATGGSLTSLIVGGVGTLVVKGDIDRAELSAINGGIGAVTIGGSVVGGDADDSGEVLATGNIGTVKITGNIEGGNGLNAGAIRSSTGSIGTTTVGGSVLGGAGGFSGSIRSLTTLGLVTIKQSLQGGSGTASGGVFATSSAGNLTGLSVASVVGGAGDQSGEILSGASMGAIKIANNLQGGVGQFSGSIQAGTSDLVTGAITSVTIGGYLIGGDGASSGLIAAQEVINDSRSADIGFVKIAHDLQGGSGSGSGVVRTDGKLNSLTVGGSILGGAGDFSAQVDITLNIGAVSIAGNLRGSSGEDSGFLRSDSGSISSISIGGSLLGGDGQNSGMIATNNTVGGAIGTIKIAHDIQGGIGASSGLIQTSGGAITGLTIGGQILGGAADQSGAVIAGGNLGPVTIAGSIYGGSVTGTASADQTGCIISAGRITSVTVGGSIYAGINTGTGALTASGSIGAENDIGALTVKGSLVGNTNATASTAVTISARGQAVQGATTDLAIGKIAITGRVELTQILAGYDTSLTARNPDAQIGPVTVNGDWIASDLVAGAMNSASTNSLFGNLNDAKITGVGTSTDNPAITAKITSVTIKGVVLGTAASVNPADAFGFVAESLGTFSVAGAKISLVSATTTVGTTGDVNVHEV